MLLYGYYHCDYNINHFATYVVTLLLRLAKNGGSNNQAFDKVCKVLNSSPCTVLNSEIIVYKQINSSNFDVDKLLVKAREEYRTLIEKKTWSKDTHKKTKYRHDRCMQQPTKITALVASTDQENETSHLRKDLNDLQERKCCSPAKQ